MSCIVARIVSVLALIYLAVVIEENPLEEQGGQKPK